jgi:hypothetical protein
MVQLLNNTQTAQISMVHGTMNTQQSYARPVSPYGYLYFGSPQSYDEVQNFQDLYLQRIFSVSSLNTGAWSELGNTVNWANAQNTSVWDTINIAAGAPVTAAGAKTGSLRIHTNASMYIDYTADLTATGPIEINTPKGLIIRSETSSPFKRGQLLDNGTISYPNSGSTQVWASFPQNQWHYYCIPLTEASMTSVKPYRNIYMKFYEEPSDHWKYIWARDFNPDTTLTTMKMLGYAMWASSNPPYTHDGTVRPSGLINTGSVSVSCTRSPWSGGGNNGYNLIGNPYTSSIDLRNSGWNCPVEVDPTAYYYNGSGYVTYNWSTGSGSGTRYPAPQQGFVIHMTSGSNVTINVNNSARVVTNGTPLKDLPAIPDYIILTASANGIADDAHIIFNPEATLGFDSRLDAYKLFGVEQAPNLYSRMDTIMAVNELPWTGNNQIVPLGFICGVSGNYTITASNLSSFKPGVSVLLEDATKPSNLDWQDLTKDPTYQFSYNVGEDPNRFLLHFTNPFYGVNEHALNALQIYSYEEFVYVKNLAGNQTKGDLLIYDQLGRKVFQDKLQNLMLNKFNPGLHESYYLVKVVAPDNTYTEKVYIK